MERPEVLTSLRSACLLFKDASVGFKMAPKGGADKPGSHARVPTHDWADSSFA